MQAHSCTQQRIVAVFLIFYASTILCNAQLSNLFKLISTTTIKPTTTTKLTTTTETPFVEFPPDQCPEPNDFFNKGTIASSGYPTENYGNDLHCLYNLSVEAGNKITLQFTHFDTEACCDHLVVYDGPSTTSPTLQKLSGNITRPINLKSSGNHMLLDFTTSRDVTATGWSAHFTDDAQKAVTKPPPTNSPDVCPAIEDSDNQNIGILTSPGYPYNYGNNLDCSYLITVPVGRRVSIVFQTFATETCCDIVTLYDGNSTKASIITILAGPIATPTQVYNTTKGNQMFVTFVTDGDTVMEGWSAEFFYI